jgi:hypothetical protein
MTTAGGSTTVIVEAMRGIDMTSKEAMTSIAKKMTNQDLM